MFLAMMVLSLSAAVEEGTESWDIPLLNSAVLRGRYEIHLQASSP